jgi:hypothetical protein
MLIKKHACAEQVQLFVETFGDAVEVTEESCLKAAKVGLDVDWAASFLLNAGQIAAYEEAKAPLLAAYKEAKSPLLAAYEEAKASVFYKASSM